MSGLAESRPLRSGRERRLCPTKQRSVSGCARPHLVIHMRGLEGQLQPQPAIAMDLNLQRRAHYSRSNTWRLASKGGLALPMGRLGAYAGIAELLCDRAAT